MQTLVGWGKATLILVVVVMNRLDILGKITYLISLVKSLEISTVSVILEP